MTTYTLYQGFRWFQKKINRTELVVLSVKNVLNPSLLSFGVMLIFWPYAQLNPVANTLNALKNMTHFGFPFPQIFEGRQIMATDPPWNYILKWIWITTPITILIGLFLFVALFLLTAKSEMLRKRFSLDHLGSSFPVFLILFALVFPVAYALYSKSTLYDGLRHFLFLLPLMATLAAVGYAYTFRTICGITDLKTRRTVKWTMVFLIICSLTPITNWMLRSHPNQYIYFNEILGGLKEAFGKYETEYYGNSERQATLWLNDHVKLKGSGGKIRICTYSRHLQVKYYLDTKNLIYNPTKSNIPSCDIFVANLRWGVRPNGTILHRVQVDGVPLVYVVSNEENLKLDQVDQVDAP